MHELTARQTQIISLKAKGAAHKEIASVLEISPRTVEEHLNNVVKRLNARNATHAVSLAISQGHIAAETIGLAPSQINDYLENQTVKFQLHVLRDLLARQIVGHSNFDAFSDEEREEFNRHYSVVVSKAQQRSERN